MRPWYVSTYLFSIKLTTCFNREMSRMVLDSDLCLFEWSVQGAWKSKVAKSSSRKSA